MTIEFVESYFIRLFSTCSVIFLYFLEIFHINFSYSFIFSTYFFIFLQISYVFLHMFLYISPHSFIQYLPYISSYFFIFLIILFSTYIPSCFPHISSYCPHISSYSSNISSFTKKYERNTKEICGKYEEVSWGNMEEFEICR